MSRNNHNQPPRPSAGQIKPVPPRPSSRRVSNSSSAASTASSGPGISVDGLSASDIPRTQEWAMNGSIISYKLDDIVFEPGSHRSKDRLVLRSSNDRAYHSQFKLAEDRLEFTRLLNTLRLSTNDFGVLDLQNKAKREFRERFPYVSGNAWGYRLEPPNFDRKSRKASQTSMSNVPGTAEWYGKQPMKTSRIMGIGANSDNDYIITEDFFVNDRDFDGNGTQDAKVLANLRNIQDYLPKDAHKDPGYTAMKKFKDKYSAVEYNGGATRLVISPDYEKKQRKGPRKTFREYQAEARKRRL